MSKWIISALLFLAAVPIIAQDYEVTLLSQHAYDLSGFGQTFLENEAKRVDLFMLGELHGEREIPELLTSMWPTLHRNGYHFVAGEISPWASSKLEFSNGHDSLKVEGLWTNQEARMLHKVAGKSSESILWGCDMEEIALEDLMKEVFKKNTSPGNTSEILNIINNGYNRKMAPKLLGLLDTLNLHNSLPDNESYQSMMISLRIDSARAFPASRFKAQLLRERLMKELFLKNYNTHRQSKIFVRFGRNHLHYGLDDRGISTLGNFISEFSLSKNLKCFNVATFAAGGECKLLGNTFNADERGYDSAFKFLSEAARYDVTLFDLRPLRVYLHTIAAEKLSETQRRLSYWANSYDAIICFKSVTPR